MKKKKRFRLLALALCAVLTLLPLSGCSTVAGTSSSKTTYAVTTNSDGTRTFTDMIGKTITLPAEVKSVYCTSPVGTYFVYTLDPSKLIGWNSSMTSSQLQYLDPDYADLPVLGGNMGNQATFNTEYIISLHPDVILSFGQVGQNNATIDQLSQTTGIPVVYFDYSLTSLADAYRLMGVVFNETTRGNELADYIDNTLTKVKNMVSKVPDSDKKRVYYAEAADGLKTDGADSMHSEVLNFVNATNVCTLSTAASGMGTSVSMEQVLQWDPQVILCNSTMGGDSFMSTVYTNSGWANVTAVKNKQVYEAPSYPFNWFDRPPSVARVLGTEWLASILYPDYVKVDLTSDVIKFYKEFYKVDITEDQANALIKS